MGIYAGVFFDDVAGGWLDQTLGWRTAFLAVGLPGVLAALVLKATLREPPRGMSEAVTAVDEPAPLKDVFLELWNRRSFRHPSVAGGLRWALIIVTLANVWCVAHYLLGASTLRDDLLYRSAPAG